MGKTCFIVCAIGSEDSEIRKRTDKLYKHILKPVCEKCGFNAVRVDHINQADSITQTIIDHLNKDELVIADLTDHNPNVFYEIGYRSSMKKPIIHIKQKDETIPFDIAGIRAFSYDLTDLDSVAEVKERLEQTINSFDFSILDGGEQHDVSSLFVREVAHRFLNLEYKIDDLINEIKKKNNDDMKDTEDTVSLLPIDAEKVEIFKKCPPEVQKQLYEFIQKHLNKPILTEKDI